MTDNFAPASNPFELSKHAAAAMEATGHLLGSVLADLPTEKRQAVHALLAGGGRIGISCTVDNHGRPLISLVGIEREGAHLTLATVAAPSMGSARH